MNVLLCAGDKTAKIAEYLQNKRKTSLTVEPCESIFDMLSRVEGTGFTCDKLVVLGSALDMVPADGLDVVFDTFSKLLDGVESNKEILIINKGDKGIDYERYFYKHLNAKTGARFNSEEQIKMNRFEQIISGNENEGEFKKNATPEPFRQPPAPNDSGKDVPGKKEKKQGRLGGLLNRKNDKTTPPDTKEVPPVPNVSLNTASTGIQAESPLGPVDLGEQITPVSMRNDAVSGNSVTYEALQIGGDPAASGIFAEQPPVQPALNQQMVQPVQQPAKTKGKIGGLLPGFGKEKPAGNSAPVNAPPSQNQSAHNAVSRPSKNFKIDKVKVAEMLKRNKIVMLTGNCRSGVSGTTANLAFVAQALGMKTLVLDMDMIGRGMCLYFPQEINPEENYYTYALSNAMRSPYSFDSYLWEITDYLDILGLDMSVGDVHMHEEALDSAKLSELLSYTRTHYDLILIDMPFRYMKKFGSAISVADRIAYLTENDVSSLIGIINNISPDMFVTVVDYQMFRSKCGFILNRYNPTCTMAQNIVEPQNFTLFLDQIVDDGDFSKYDIFGTVEEIPNYARQMDGGTLLCESSGFVNVFFDMLYCFYK